MHQSYIKSATTLSDNYRFVYVKLGVGLVCISGLTTTVQLHNQNCRLSDITLKISSGKESRF